MQLISSVFISSNSDAESTDDENTTFGVEEGLTKEREVEENVVLTGVGDEANGSKTPEPQSDQAADRSGSGELMRRYLELSKTTNRVSEAARIEEERSETRSHQIMQNADSEKKATLKNFLKNSEVR